MRTSVQLLLCDNLYSMHTEIMNNIKLARCMRRGSRFKSLTKLHNSHFECPLFWVTHLPVPGNDRDLL